MGQYWSYQSEKLNNNNKFAGDTRPVGGVS